MARTAQYASERRRFERGPDRLAAAAAGLGLAGLAAGLALGPRVGWDVFFRSYLLNYCFVLSLALGALFFVMLQHLTRAGWSVALRRIAEFVVAALPWLAVLFLPLLIPVFQGRAGVYKWSSPEVVAGDPLLQAKAAWLNPAFFTVRCLVYLAVWSLLAVVLVRDSVRQDATGDVAHTHRLERWSAPGMLLYGLTVTFFAFDVLMSLNPHWYSTIFGVYFFSGCVVGFFALLALLVLSVQRAGGLTASVTVEHYHDLGKLMFGFVVFWAYIAFSQYMLQWYANLPEETALYFARQNEPWWRGVSLLLLVGHFVAPFLALISRFPKRRPGLLLPAAVWLLAMHWLDLYYLVMPRPHGTAYKPAAYLHWTDLALLVGLVGPFVAAVVRPMARHALLPERDPRLTEALAFENI